MSKAKDKIPKQLYVTFNEREVRRQEPPWDVIDTEIIGFMQHYSTDKAGLKRIETQMEWAYGRQHLKQLDGIDDPAQIDAIINPANKGYFHSYSNGWWKVHDLYYQAEYNHNTKKMEWHGVPTHLVPQIWDNIPMNGFKIVGSVSRCSTSNKLWQILDPRGPRGTILEISTASMEDILMNGTVIKGHIQDFCVWKSGKNLVIAK